MPGDNVQIVFNDHQLEPSPVDVQDNLKLTGFELTVPPDCGTLGMPAQASIDQRCQAIRLPIPIQFLKTGRNTICIQLNRRGLGSEKPLQITRIEISAT
jgi:hypothetical protein